MGGGTEGGTKLGGLRVGNLQRARALFPYVCADAVSYDPAILQPRVTYRAAAGSVRGRDRLVFLDEWWTPHSVSSVCGCMELRVEVHAGAMGSDRVRGGGWKRPVDFSAQAQTGRGFPVDRFCGCAVPQPRQRPP